MLGDKRHSHLLIDFLNELFGGEKKITPLTYDSDGFRDPADSRSKVFDIPCTGSNGLEFPIETQRSNHPDFTDRAFYHVWLSIQKWVETIPTGILYLRYTISGSVISTCVGIFRSWIYPKPKTRKLNRRSGWLGTWRDAHIWKYRKPIWNLKISGPGWTNGITCSSTWAHWIKSFLP